MASTFPGTTIEVSALEADSSVVLFDGIFAAGGITLSQVSVMTGLEPYVIQNWVKRGFVSSPIKRMYDRDQFARIVIINMLRETLRLDQICELLRLFEKQTDGDARMGDAHLYHSYVNMACDPDMRWSDTESVQRAAARCIGDGLGHDAGRKRQLVEILQIMLYAHASARLRQSAEGRLSDLES